MQKLHAPHFIQKAAPAAKGMVQTTVVYVGVDKVFSFVDNLAGSPVQKIGIAVPILGRLSLLDVIEYMTVARGLRFDLDTTVAFFANKFLNQGVAGLPFLRSQISSGAGATQISPAVVTTGSGAPIG